MRLKDGKIITNFWAEDADGGIHLFVSDWRNKDTRFVVAAVCGYDGPRALVNPPVRTEHNCYPSLIHDCCERCVRHYEEQTGRLLLTSEVRRQG